MTGQICWHGPESACRDFHDDRTLIWFGCCPSGRRWFWFAEEQTGEYRPPCSHGREDSEEAALAAARAAVTGIAAARPAMARQSLRGTAAVRLREANAAARAARPPSDSGEAQAVEYLYAAYVSSWVDDMTGRDRREVIPFRIIRKTARRVYYARSERRGEVVTGFVDRAALERDGRVDTRQYWKADWHLFLRREDAEADLLPPEAAAPDLRQLRQEMADAHPDRGGDRDRFMAARERYLRARARERKPA